MKKIALLFPGQGSHYIGMAQNIYKEYKCVKEIFEQASNTLKMDLTKYCFYGNLEELNKTENCQPALLTVCYSYYQVFKNKSGIDPDIFAGHSLGEYTALVCSGAIDFLSALQLVRTRGLLMSNEAEKQNGIMAAINGIDNFLIMEACNQINNQKNEVIVIAAFNSLNQTVISGLKDSVTKVVELLQVYNPKVVYLNNNGAFHSPLMDKAVLEFKKEIDNTDFTYPGQPVISNYTGLPFQNIDEIKKNLVLHLSQPVKWLQTINYLMDNGISIAVELGPKNILKNLLNDNLYLNVYSYDDINDQQALVNEIYIKEDKMKFLTKSLAIAVSTKNNNWDENEYNIGVVQPYNKIKELYNSLVEKNQEPTIDLLRETYNLLTLIFKTKKISEDEKKQRIKELFLFSGAKNLMNEIIN